jgi:WD40 repeat protein
MRMNDDVPIAAPARVPHLESLPTQIGRFHIIKKHDEGGFGIVYLAYDPQLEREVALKVPRAGTINSERRVQRFLGDARSAAQLRHPNIVPVYDAGQVDGQLFIASAFVPGHPLSRLIDKQRLFEPTRAARIVHALAEALGYAHRFGIIHRDVKPGNIMIDAEDRPHVIDFGLAYRGTPPSGDSAPGDGAKEETTGVSGTPAYMSPEQAAGGTPQAASDQYSLGVTLYELLCGQTPFDGPTAIKLFNAINTTPPTPRSYVPSIPLDLEVICLTAMAKRPEERYAGCEEMAEDLRRWLADEPITKRKQTLRERAFRWCKREPALMLAIGVAAAAILAVAILATVFGFSQARSAERNKLAWEAAERARQDAEMAREDADDARLDAEESEEAAKRERDKAKESEGVAKRERDNAVASERVAKAAREEAEKSKKDAIREQIRMTINHGQTHFDATREWSQGMAWFVAALRNAEKVGDDDLAWDMRMSLAGWGPHLNVLVGAHAHKASFKAAVLAGPDQFFAAEENSNNSNTVRLWELAGKTLLDLKQEEGDVSALAYYQDEKRKLLAVGCKNGDIVLWDVANRFSPRRARSLKSGTSPVNALAFHPEGVAILSAHEDGVARIWRGGEKGGLFRDADERLIRAVPLKHTDGHTIRAVAFSPKGDQILTGTKGPFAGGEARLWSYDGRVATRPAIIPHRFAVNAVAFSPNGEFVATGGGSLYQGEAQLWELHAKELQRAGDPLPHDAEVFTLSFSADGSWLATAGMDRAARVWGVRSGKLHGQPLRHPEAVNIALFLPDGHRLLTDSDEKAFRVWKLAASPQPLEYVYTDPDSHHADPVMSADLSETGEYLLTGGFGRALLWKTSEPGNPLRFFPHGGGYPLRAVGFNHFGTRLLTAGGTSVQVRDIDEKNGVPQPTVLTHVIENKEVKEVLRAVFSPKQRLIATGCTDGLVRIWDTTTGTLRRTLGGDQPYIGHVYGLAFSPNGETILVGGTNSTASLYDVETGRRLKSWNNPNAVLSAAFAADNQTILIGCPGSAHLWNWDRDRKEVTPVGVPCQIWTGVISVAFSPDGRTMLTGGTNGNVQLWDRHTQRPLGPPWHRNGCAFAVAYHPDGHHILTAHTDENLQGTVDLWELPVALTETVDRLELWTRSIGGWKLEGGVSSLLRERDWQEVQLQLEKLGGPPKLSIPEGPVHDTERPRPTGMKFPDK